MQTERGQRLPRTNTISFVGHDCRRQFENMRCRQGTDDCSKFNKTSCRREAATLRPRPNVDRQRLALGGGVEYGVVHLNHVVTWTANRSGLVTLTFDLLTLKVVSE